MLAGGGRSSRERRREIREASPREGIYGTAVAAWSERIIFPFCCRNTTPRLGGGGYLIDEIIAAVFRVRGYSNVSCALCNTKYYAGGNIRLCYSAWGSRGNWDAQSEHRSKPRGDCCSRCTFGATFRVRGQCGSCLVQ